MPVNLKTSFVAATALLSWILIYPPRSSLASNETCLKITEVYAAPASGESEWVEIWNCGKTSQDLTNYQLFDQISTPSNIASLDCIIVQPNSYAVIDLSTAKLNNSGDGVTLINYDQEVVDQMNYSTTKTQYSWALVINDIEQFWVLTLPSRGLPNPSPTPTPTILPASSPTSTITPAFNPTLTLTPSPTASSNTPTPTATPVSTHTPIDKSQLKLTELVACPVEGETEWLELYWSGTENLDFSNWKIQDKSDNQVNLSGTLYSKKYSVFSWSKSLLNNTGDELFLYDQTDQELIHLTLPGCQAGQSYSLNGNKYILTEAITKGTANQIHPTTTPLLSISPTTSPTPTVHQLTVIQSITPAVLGITTSSAQTVQNQTENLLQYHQALPQLKVLTKINSVNSPNSESCINLADSHLKINWSAVSVIIGSIIIVGASSYILYEQKKSDARFIL